MNDPIEYRFLNISNVQLKIEAVKTILLQCAKKPYFKTYILEFAKLVGYSS